MTSVVVTRITGIGQCTRTMYVVSDVVIIQFSFFQTEIVFEKSAEAVVAEEESTLSRECDVTTLSLPFLTETMLCWHFTHCIINSAEQRILL